MKSNLFTYLLLAVMAVSCSKTEDKNVPNSATEPALVQEAQTLKCENGSSLTAVYFADGDQVAVKIKKDTEPEQTLAAKGTNEKGEPFFANETYTWELMENGQAGKLSDKEGKGCVYK
ncbi:MAG: hypothetical protein K0M63_07980 [Weeksellaceae bacterium]|nr:hypothetical protein [Weeksellaceae bacterium]